MKPKVEIEDTDDEEDDTVDGSLEDRTKDYSELKSIQKQLGDVYAAVEKGFEDKNQQNSIIDEGWDMYNCVLNENQEYQGSAKIYVPIVRDAISARETRFINTLFPGSGRFTDIIAGDGHQPYDLIALMDYYVREAQLRQLVIPAMLRTGDVAGQYALYVDWVTRTRCVASKTKVAEMETELGTPVDGSPEYDDITYEEVEDARPGVMVLDPRNLLILPATVDTIEEAESVTVVLRFTEKKIKKWIKDGLFERKAAETLLKNMSATTAKQLPDTGKKAASVAGVTTDSKGNKVALVFQTWTKLKIKGEYRMMVVHFGGAQLILGCKRNPYWCDRIPVITQAVEKNPDTIWGSAPADKVKKIQYQANDVANMGFDSARYALLPIVMTDPEKNPNAGSMVLAMASVWLTDPNSTKFAEFPPLWKDAFSIIGACKDQIFQSLGVNPAMVPHGNAGKKPSQAQIAQEQQVALESAADNISLIQEGILSRLIEWFYELDYQYRDKAVTVKKFGTLGLQATMDQVEPFQVRQRYEFKWYGMEGFKAAQQIQQQISWLNVLRGIPPEMLSGRKVDLGPAIEIINGNILGPRVAPHVLIDQRHQLTMDAEMENRLLANQFPVQVHEMDNDQEHIQAHFSQFEHLLQLPPEISGDENVQRLVKGHILEHIQSMKKKAAAAMGAQPGMLGGPGQPKPGAQAQPPTGGQAPPGAVSPDNMPTAMPRRGGV